MQKLKKQHDILCVSRPMRRYLIWHIKKTKQVYAIAAENKCSIKTVMKRECYPLDEKEISNMEYCLQKREPYDRIVIYDKSLLWRNICLSKYLKKGMHHHKDFVFAYLYEQGNQLHVVLFYRNQEKRKNL